MRQVGKKQEGTVFRERETCETIIQDPRRKTIIDLRWRRFAAEKRAEGEGESRRFLFPSLFPFPLPRFPFSVCVDRKGEALFIATRP